MSKCVLDLNGRGQPWQVFCKNVTISFTVKEDTLIKDSMHRDICGWKANVLLRAKHTGRFHRRLGSSHERLQHSKRTIYSFHFLLCITDEERVLGCMKTGSGLMLHENHGEFILMGKQPLKPSSHDFFISHREQEVSQLTGANAANCAVDKRWGMEKRRRERERTQCNNRLRFS